ncbi:hypothetical protein ACWJJH_17965 [Endozoicomonadaceae bacterium StTr2]
MQRIKSIAFSGLVLFGLVGGLAGCAVSYQDYAQVGDNEAAVVEKIGKPEKRIVSGDFVGVQYSSRSFESGDLQKQFYVIIFYGDKLYKQGYGQLKQQDQFPPLVIHSD